MNTQDLNSLLNRFTISKVQLRKNRKTEALDFWQPIVNAIVENVKRRDARFANLRTLPTGSYYERAKVKEPNEFDLMLVIDAPAFHHLSVDSITALLRAQLTVPPLGFIQLIISSEAEKVKWQHDSCINAWGILNASQVKAVFARLVRDAIGALSYERYVAVKSHGPAVTLQITDVNGRVYSVDLTLALRFIEWPTVAEEWSRRRRNGWPNQQLVRDICQDGCHLVAKQPKGSNVPDQEKGIFWRFSFSASEKKLFLHAGHGEASSCRKQVLRILKALKEEKNLHPLTSYHLKTMLFYECEANPHPSHWSSDRLSERFIGLLERLENCLRQLNCPHYFIKDLNLFELFSYDRCSELAGKVQQIRLYPERTLISLMQ